jgi:hypothetical protein
VWDELVRYDSAYLMNVLVVACWASSHLGRVEMASERERSVVLMVDMISLSRWSPGVVKCEEEAMFMILHFFY